MVIIEFDDCNQRSGEMALTGNDILEPIHGRNVQEMVSGLFLKSNIPSIAGLNNQRNDQ